MSYHFRKSITIIFLVCTANVFAQDWAKTNIQEQQRVDLRDLGYPLVNEIPSNSSAITSLIAARDGKIYGATSGENSYLFLFDPILNKVRHLGKIKGEQGVHHSLVEDNDGFIYIGTGKDMFEEMPIKNTDKNEQIDISLWRDIKNHFSTYPGGHIYRYQPKMSNKKVKLPEMDCELEDLGIPIPHNSIYSLTINPKGDVMYGVSYPDGYLFQYTIVDKQFSNLGTLDEKIVFHGPERSWRSLPRAIICDDSGRAFTSGSDGLIKYYSPTYKKVITTNLKIPADNYDLQFYEDYAVVDYFSKSSEGLIYGGSSDGYLFSLDVHSMKLSNLGKVRSSRRLRGIAVGIHGKVYLVAGERSSSKPCQFYCYDPVSGSFEDFGLLIADKSPYYYSRGEQFDSMITGNDGTIYLGETERRSHLFLYIPE